MFAVGFGFAMQNIAQNFVSGIILLVERSIKPGDVVIVEGRMVRIKRMGIRATVARSVDEAELIIPNSSLVQTTVHNLTLSDSLARVRARVGVAYESDLKQVREVLTQTADALDWRDRSFAPRVLLVDFADSAVLYEVSVWTREPWDAPIRAQDVREAIFQAFRETGITIAFPQMDVHIKTDSELKVLSPAA